jgi:hypothetical protein
MERGRRRTWDSRAKEFPRIAAEIGTGASGQKGAVVDSMILSSLSDAFPNVIATVSNYDVLLTVSSSEPPWTMADLMLDPAVQHIGNNRFRIMCQMHAQQTEVVYDMIVQHPCLDIDGGRGGTFLCRDGEQWRELPKAYALAFVQHQVGSNAGASKESKDTEPNGEDEGMKRRRRSSLLRRSLSSGNMLEDQKKRFAFRRSLLLSDLSTGSEEDDEVEAEDVVGDEPSFFRNTSGGTASTRRPTLERLPSWSEGMDELFTVVHTANALDVIFKKSTFASQERYQLVSSHHTGNNRLLVMVQLRLPKYLTLMDAVDPMNATSLCMELVAAVQENYSGRFLVEPEVDKDYFILLTDEEAATAIHCLFQSEAELEASAGTTTSGGDHFVVVEPNARPAVDTGSSMNGIIQNNSRTPSLIKREALQHLHELSTSLSDVISSNPDVTAADPGRSKPEGGGIQKFALESLQKRKKRQGLTNKISQMVAYNPSAAVVASRVERRSSVSELPRRSFAGLTRWASTGHSINQQHPLDWHSSAPSGLHFAGESSVRDFGLSEANVPSTIPEWDEALLEPTDFGLSDVPIREQMQMYQNNNVAILEQHPFYQLQEPVRRRPSALSHFSQVMIQDMLLKLDGMEDPTVLLEPEASAQWSNAVPSAPSTTRSSPYERTEI